MREFGFTALGVWLYAALLSVLPTALGSVVSPMMAHTIAGFMLGYCTCAVLDLYRCWRLAQVDKVKPTRLELSFAALLLFPIGSLFWFPWDVARWINRQLAH